MEQFKTKKQEIDAFEHAFDVIKGFTEPGHEHICKHCWDSFTEIVPMQVLYMSHKLEVYGCPQCQGTLTFQK